MYITRYVLLLRHVSIFSEFLLTYYLLSGISTADSVILKLTRSSLATNRKELKLDVSNNVGI
jgi:hypothetical protein